MEFKNRFIGKLNMRYYGMYIIGALIRLYLSTSEYQQVIANRREVSTPLNAWKRVIEGVYLWKLDIQPYTTDILHVPPLQLLVYNYLVEICGQYIYLLFTFIDMITAYLLHITTKKYIMTLQENQQKNSSKYAEGANDILLVNKDCTLPLNYVTAAYLFNPYIIFNCVGFTTTVFDNFFMSLFLFGLTYGNIVLSTLPLAICITQNLYPSLLISPLVLQFFHTSGKIKAVLSLLFVIGFWSLLTYSSFLVFNSWDFLESTYGYILTVPDLRPTIGLFWYFFIEMFEHFRPLFIYSFQINVTLLYYIPLTIRFRNDPLLLTTSLLALTAIFKSYPCLGDTGFILALLPCWKHLFNYLQQGFIVCCSFYITTILGPIVWYLWIYLGSANANFYFGVTLAFATAQIFLITDLLFACIKWEFTLIYGRKRKVNDENAQLILE